MENYEIMSNAVTFALVLAFLLEKENSTVDFYL